MCVAIYKPHGQKIPSEDTLKKCWDANDDGAGYAALNQEGDRYFWKVNKGIMKWEDFLAQFNAEEFDDDDTLFIHFRIKSAGKIEPGQTHPFPVCDDYDQMKQTVYEADWIVMHNGTCGFGEDGASDTMKFIKDVFDPLAPYIADKKVDKLLTSIVCETRDKWVFGYGDQVWYYGQFHEVEGVHYSNLSWRTTYRSSGFRGVYGDAYGYNEGWRNHRANVVQSVMEKTGEVMPDGEVIWDVDRAVDSSKSFDTNDDFILLCPNCFEDKYLDNSPYVDVGDTLCLKCGAVFEEDTGDILMYDEDIKAGKQNSG